MSPSIPVSLPTGTNSDKQMAKLIGKCLMTRWAENSQLLPITSSLREGGQLRNEACSGDAAASSNIDKPNLSLSGSLWLYFSFMSKATPNSNEGTKDIGISLHSIHQLSLASVYRVNKSKAHLRPWKRQE